MRFDQQNQPSQPYTPPLNPLYESGFVLGAKEEREEILTLLEKWRLELVTEGMPFEKAVHAASVLRNLIMNKPTPSPSCIYTEEAQPESRK